MALYSDKVMDHFRNPRNLGTLENADGIGAEQMIILGHGSLRVSARAFKQEVEAVNGEIRKILESQNSLR